MSHYCEECGRTFASEDGLAIHERVAHDIDADVPGWVLSNE